jgi:hypothetical protein
MVRLGKKRISGGIRVKKLSVAEKRSNKLTFLQLTMNEFKMLLKPSSDKLSLSQSSDIVPLGSRP